MPIGMTTFTRELVLAGDISPKFNETDRLVVVDDEPVTEPFKAPVMVGVPPLDMSRDCAVAAHAPPTIKRIDRM